MRNQDRLANVSGNQENQISGKTVKGQVEIFELEKVGYEAPPELESACVRSISKKEPCLVLDMRMLVEQTPLCTLWVTSSAQPITPILPGEAHEDRVAWTLGHIPLHPTTLVKKQGIGPAPIGGENGLVGARLLLVGGKQKEFHVRDEVSSLIPPSLP